MHYDYKGENVNKKHESKKSESVIFVNSDRLNVAE